MDQFTKEDLKELIDGWAKRCVSLYLPTHRAPVEGRQDLIRFKNMVRAAEERLVGDGLRGAEAKEFLAPVSRLLDDPAFWQYRGDGLAVFRSNDTLRHYRLPMHFDELVVVAPRFHLKPLIPLFTEDAGFFVLALSQNALRLIQGNRFCAWELELGNIPTNLADALNNDDPERQLQFRGKASSGAGRGNAVAFSHGGVECCKEDIHRYFHLIDKGLKELIRPAGTPLILAGVEYLFPIYREVNTYPNLLGKGIAGNPDLLSPEELHARAWKLLQPNFQKAGEEMIAHYNRLAGTGRTSRDIKEIIPAASQGQVEKLMVAVGVQVWGSYQPDRKAVELSGKPGNGSEDLLDLAAVQTILNGGTVYAVQPEAIPDESCAMAILRY
jgi:hypothetical protein